MKINLNFWLKLRSKLILNTSLLLQNVFGKGFVKDICYHYAIKQYHKNNINEKRELKTNDVVLIQDGKTTPRNNWRKRK